MHFFDFLSFYYILRLLKVCMLKEMCISHVRKHMNNKSDYFQGLTLFLSYAILAAVLGMLQFGYNTGVINAPEVVRFFFKHKKMRLCLYIYVQ